MFQPPICDHSKINPKNPQFEVSILILQQTRAREQTSIGLTEDSAERWLEDLFCAA